MIMKTLTVRWKSTARSILTLRFVSWTRKKLHSTIEDPLFVDLVSKEARAQVRNCCNYFCHPTVFVESLFSGMNLNKSKMRSSMLDGTCVAVLKARELTAGLDESYDGKMEGAPIVVFQRALLHNLDFVFQNHSQSAPSQVVTNCLTNHNSSVG